MSHITFAARRQHSRQMYTISLAVIVEYRRVYIQREVDNILLDARAIYFTVGQSLRL